MKEENRIANLCYDYLTQGYLFGVFFNDKEIMKVIKEKKIDQDPTFIKMKEEIIKRLGEIVGLSCDKCHSELKDDDKFCSKCGEKVI